MTEPMTPGDLWSIASQHKVSNRLQLAPAPWTGGVNKRHRSDAR